MQSSELQINDPVSDQQDLPVNQGENEDVISPETTDQASAVCHLSLSLYLLYAFIIQIIFNWIIW